MLSGLAKGLGLGALAMYYLDPNVGRRRRSLLRDQLRGAYNDVCDFVDRGWRDLTNRMEGFAAQQRTAFSRQTPQDDVLAERVRAVMGRHVGHPGALRVEAEQGRVILSGPILAAEVPQFVAAVRAVPGVNQVENRLEVHEEPNISALQGGGQCRMSDSRRRLVGNWSPARRLVAATAGLAMLGNCALRRNGSAALCGVLGAGLLAGAFTGQSGLRMLQPRTASARGRTSQGRTAPSGRQPEEAEVSNQAEGMRAFAEQSQWQAEQPQVGEPLKPPHDIAPPSRQLPDEHVPII